MPASGQAPAAENRAAAQHAAPDAGKPARDGRRSSIKSSVDTRASSWRCLPLESASRLYAEFSPPAIFGYFWPKIGEV